ncbi:MAG: ABC transporter permease, partial [Paraburkholderia graminis]
MTQSTVSAQRDEGAQGGAAFRSALLSAFGSLRQVGASLAPWVAPLLILLAWEAAARSGVLSTRVLP